MVRCQSFRDGFEEPDKKFTNWKRVRTAWVMSVRRTEERDVGLKNRKYQGSRDGTGSNDRHTVGNLGQSSSTGHHISVSSQRDGSLSSRTAVISPTEDQGWEGRTFFEVEVHEVLPPHTERNLLGSTKEIFCPRFTSPLLPPR